MSHDPTSGQQPPADGRPTPYDGGGFGQGGTSSPDQQYGTAQPHRNPYGQDQRQPYAGSYGQGQQPPYQQTYRSIEGEKAAQLSLILGIVGLFFAGIILGPIAIWQARKAEQHGVPATVGKVLGWISTILWALSLLMGIIFFVIILAGIGASSSYSG